ncbi:hypothetical protein ABW19_dt0200954 [Dactylella cylindrospora]|nr:hypothetical protein ABW19_dt0200954 [Dactylella cylindrospora]
MATKSRHLRTQLLSKDPTTAAEAGQTIRSLAATLGWTQAKGAAAKRRLTHIYSKEKNAKCTICQDTYLGYEVVRLNCGHRHCHDCLRQNYQCVLNDPTAYPPKCCSILPLMETAFVLDDAELKTILELKVSYEASKVIPCFSCQGDIFLSDIGRDAAYCLKCDKLTCTTCRKEMHSDLCPEDPETESLKQLAKDQGWTQCPKCNRVIHRTAGCTNMTCLCKAMFCFRCAKSTCECKYVPGHPSNPLKSNADISFGSTLATASSNKGASFQEKASFKMIREFRRAALGNRENNKVKLSGFKAQRQKMELEMEVARKIVKLRVKMGDLDRMEKATRDELRRKARKEGRSVAVVVVVPPERRITRSITKGTNPDYDEVVLEDIKDTRPVAARTRSRKV